LLLLVLARSGASSLRHGVKERTVVVEFESLAKATFEGKDMDIEYIIPLHCTGEPFYETVKAEMPNKLLRSYTGT
jgi:metal-dependent hydrolase (beta-lactamase superfamily II)